MGTSLHLGSLMEGEDEQSTVLTLSSCLQEPDSTSWVSPHLATATAVTGRPWSVTTPRRLFLSRHHTCT